MLQAPVVLPNTTHSFNFSLTLPFILNLLSFPQLLCPLVLNLLEPLPLFVCGFLFIQVYSSVRGALKDGMKQAVKVVVPLLFWVKVLLLGTPHPRRPAKLIPVLPDERDDIEGLRVPLYTVVVAFLCTSVFSVLLMYQKSSSASWSLKNTKVGRFIMVVRTSCQHCTCAWDEWFPTRVKN